MAHQTFQLEDYLERMLEIVQEKGQVRAIEVAERLGVSKASVSQMTKRLEKDGFIKREMYRGFTLTEKGKSTGKKIQKRHEILTDFLTLMQIPTSIQEKDIEGMEHSLSNSTLAALEKLITYLQKKQYLTKNI